MNHPTEIRTYHDMQQQIELERMLAARKARDAAREARFRTLPTPQQPEPVQMCAVEEVPAAVPPWTVRAGIVAYLLTLAGSALLSVYWASPAVRGFVEMLRAQP